jgi:hypothetical protein
MESVINYELHVSYNIDRKIKPVLIGSGKFRKDVGGNDVMPCRTSSALILLVIV